MTPKSKRNPYNTYQYSSTYVSVPKPPKGSKSPRRHRLRKFIAIVLVLVVVAAAIGLAHSKDANKLAKTAKSDKVTSHTKSNVEAAPAASSISAAEISTMSGAINSIISQNSGVDISVSLIDLTNNQAENYGDSQPFTAASTTKVITAADYLNQVEQGNLSLSQTVNGETAEYEIQQMIVVSDDNAWDALNDTLGYSQLQSYADSIGVNTFQSENNTVSAANMALLLQELYEGKLLNSSDTQLLLSYMLQANYREYIVPAVPTTDTIYHKVGFYLTFLNDEAIITDGTKSFVIVIFTNDGSSSDFASRALIMQQITKAALAAYF